MAALALSTALWTSHPSAAGGTAAAAASGQQEARFQPSDNMLPRFNHFHTAAQQQPYESSVARRGGGVLEEHGQRERGKAAAAVVAEAGAAEGGGAAVGARASSSSAATSSTAAAAAPPARSSSRRASSRRRREARRWHDRSSRGNQIDSEFDVVIVPSDGISMSGSESDDSDWSVGWFEPHCPGFLDNESEEDSSFAVLVPCYGAASPKLNLEQRNASSSSPDDLPFWSTMRLSPMAQHSDAGRFVRLRRLCLPASAGLFVSFLFTCTGSSCSLPLLGRRLLIIIMIIRTVGSVVPAGKCRSVVLAWSIASLS